jgi:hypothetical protein
MDAKAALDVVSVFTKTEIFNTLVAGAMGAFFGAVGAQVIVSRAQEKQRVSGELNSVNSAVMLSWSICSTFVGLKKQHVRDLVKRFEDEQQRFREFREKPRPNLGVPEVFILRLDLQSLSPITTPIKALEGLVFERISLAPRLLALAAQLIGAIDGLGHTIKVRQELIDEQIRLKRDGEVLCGWYLGTPIKDVIDGRFAMNVKAISNQTDDCIFFAKELGYELTRYGKTLRTRKLTRLHFGLPKIVIADWGDVEAAGLFPSDDLYKSWFTSFKKQPGLLSRIKAAIHRAIME